MGLIWGLFGCAENAGKRKEISLDDSKLPKTMELWFFAIKRRKGKGGRKGKLIISHLWNSLDIQTWHCHNYTFSSKTWKRKKIKTLNHILQNFNLQDWARTDRARPKLEIWSIFMTLGRRWFRRWIPADWARCIQVKPLIDTFRMEAMLAFRYDL